MPVSARKLESMVRLAEASARTRLSTTVEEQDIDRVEEIVRANLEAIGRDPETGAFDADVVETSSAKNQRDRIQNIKGIIIDIESEYDRGAPKDVVIERAEEVGLSPAKVENEIERLFDKGEIYTPAKDYLRTT